MKKISVGVIMVSLILVSVGTVALAQNQAPEQPQTATQQVRFGTGLSIARFTLPKLVVDLPIKQGLLRVGAGGSPFHQGSFEKGITTGTIIEGTSVLYFHNIKPLGFEIHFGAGVNAAMVSARSSEMIEGVTYFPVAIAVRSTTSLPFVTNLEPHREFNVWITAGLNIQLGKLFVGPVVEIGLWF